MITTREALTQVFYSNFAAYFRSHVAHVNVMGRNFTSDHQLLSGVYEDLQGQIDTIAELLRTLGEFMPNELQEVVNVSAVNTGAIEGDSIDLLTSVKDDLTVLKEIYEDLMMSAESEGLQEIANYSQDRILALAKHIWMLESTLA